MQYGYAGKILYVGSTNGSFEVDPITGTSHHPVSQRRPGRIEVGV